MLCNSCNKDIFDDDVITCSIYNEYYHFMCAELEESTFRKMTKLIKSKWTCSKCKLNDKHKSPSVNAAQIKKPFLNITNEYFYNLTDSVNFMSGKSDSLSIH